jgi:hypothetical protein
MRHAPDMTPVPEKLKVIGSRYRREGQATRVPLIFRSESDLVYHDEVRGELFRQVDRTLDLLLTKYLKAAIHYEGIQRIERFPVPRAALREALLNALVHRDYAVGAPVQIRVYQDLFYRLSVFPIEIPALRKRPEDIAPLAQHFIAQTARRMNRHTPRITQATMKQLSAHDWPGNVRELQNAIERPVILSQGGPVRFELPELQKTDPAAPGNATPMPGAFLTRDELKHRERESMVAALKQSGGKVFGANGTAEAVGSAEKKYSNYGIPEIHGSSIGLRSPGSWASCSLNSHPMKNLPGQIAPSFSCLP